MDRGIVGRLEATTALAVRIIEPCDAAGLALVIRGSTRSVAVTDEVVLEVDLVQYDTGEGPCLDAIRESNVIRFDFLDPNEHWEHFAPGALAHGVRSVLSTPLRSQDETLGALNLYSQSPDGFDAEAEHLAEQLAKYAADVIAKSPLYAYSLDLFDNAIEELSGLELINCAIGILMARGGCDAEAANRELSAVADRYNETLHGAAEWVLREQQLRLDETTRPAGPGEDT